MDGRSQINPRAAKLMLMTCWGAVSWTELLTGGGVPCSDEPSLAPPPCRRLAGLGNADLTRIGRANGDGWRQRTDSWPRARGHQLGRFHHRASLFCIWKLI